MRIRRTLVAVALVGPLTLTGCADGAEDADADSVVREGGEGAEQEDEEEGEEEGDGGIGY
jgi:hypothetical protein